MRPACRALIASLALLAVGGCSLLPSTRKLPVPKPPAVIQDATAEQLVERINQRWDAVNTLTATVEIKATVVKETLGSARDYPSVHGHILLRKPDMLRVFASDFGVRMFDMQTDGREFTLFMPPLKRAMKGPNKVTKKTDNQWLNLRTGFFQFKEALLVRGLLPTDEFMVTADTDTVEDAAKKHLDLVPEYILTIMQPNTSGGHKQTPVRVVHFHRQDLLPYQQDLYDAQGNLETQIFYTNYQDFDGAKYPASITVKRPIDGVQIVMTVDDVHENTALADEQFKVMLDDGTKLETIE